VQAPRLQAGPRPGGAVRAALRRCRGAGHALVTDYRARWGSLTRCRPAHPQSDDRDLWPASALQGRGAHAPTGCADRWLQADRLTRSRTSANRGVNEQYRQSRAAASRSDAFGCVLNHAAPGSATSCSCVASRPASGPERLRRGPATRARAPIQPKPGARKRTVPARPVQAHQAQVDAGCGSASRCFYQLHDARTVIAHR